MLCLVSVPVDAPISVVELFSYNPGTFVPKNEKQTRFIKISSINATTLKSNFSKS